MNLQARLFSGPAAPEGMGLTWPVDRTAAGARTRDAGRTPAPGEIAEP